MAVVEVNGLILDLFMRLPCKKHLQSREFDTSNLGLLSVRRKESGVKGQA